MLKESLQAAENDLSERLRHHSREALEKIARRLGQYEVIKQSYDLPELVEMILNAWREKRSEDLCMRLGWNAYQSICDLLHTCKQEGGGFSLPYYELSMRSRESIMELHDLGLAFEDDQSGWYISALVEAYLSSVDDELQEQMRMSDSILWPLDSLLEKWGLCELHLFSRTLQCYFSDSPIDFSDTDITRVLEARRGTDAFVSWEDEVYVVSRNWRQNPRLMEDMCGCLYHKLPYASFHDVSEMFKSSNIRGLSLNLAAYQYLALLDPSPEIPWNSSASIEAIWEICMLRARESWRSAMLLSALFRAGILIKRGHPRKARKLLLTSARDCIAQDDAKRQRLLRWIIHEFVETSPQWALKGWSARDVMQTVRMTDAAWNEVVPAEKVNRSCSAAQIAGQSGMEPDAMEPEDETVHRCPSARSLCPCGSGRLFYLCHGRGN